MEPGGSGQGLPEWEMVAFGSHLQSTGIPQSLSLSERTARQRSAREGQGPGRAVSLEAMGGCRVCRRPGPVTSRERGNAVCLRAAVEGGGPKSA